MKPVIRRPPISAGFCIAPPAHPTGVPPLPPRQTPIARPPLPPHQPAAPAADGTAHDVAGHEGQAAHQLLFDDVAPPGQDTADALGGVFVVSHRSTRAEALMHRSSPGARKDQAPAGEGGEEISAACGINCRGSGPSVMQKALILRDFCQWHGACYPESRQPSKPLSRGVCMEFAMLMAL